MINLCKGIEFYGKTTNFKNLTQRSQSPSLDHMKLMAHASGSPTTTKQVYGLNNDNLVIKCKKSELDLDQ